MKTIKIREIIEYKIVKKDITAPFVTGTKSSPWVRVGKKVINIRKIGIDHTEKFLQVINIDSFSLKVINEKIKTATNIKLKIVDK